MMGALLLLLSIDYFNDQASRAFTNTAQTRNGAVRGTVAKLDGIRLFQGVPYAEVCTARPNHGVVGGRVGGVGGGDLQLPWSD